MASKTLTTNRRNTKKTARAQRPRPVPALAKVESAAVLTAVPTPITATTRRLGAHLHARIQRLAEVATELALTGDQPQAHLAIEAAVECAKQARRLGAFDSDGEFAQCLYDLAAVRDSLALVEAPRG